jgi:predicted nucleic acid-binding protein
MNATLASEVIVIDANVAVWTMLPAVATPGVDAQGRFQSWIWDETQLVAPTLWLAECISAIRSLIYSRTVLSAEGHAAIRDLFALEVELVSLDEPLCHAALDWAARIGQAKAYDAFYLALADRLGAEFWTADRRLANAARQTGMSSAHWVGEP